MNNWENTPEVLELQLEKNLAFFVLELVIDDSLDIF